jgi:arylsulfatase A-like enzyme
VDFLSTILDVVGIEVQTPAQGVSLVPWMEGRERANASGPVYAQVSLRAVKTVDVVSFEKGGWKIIVNKLPEQTYELYQVSEDPGEQRDLRPMDPAITQLVGNQLMEFEKALPRADVRTVDLTPEEIKRLKSLGYIQ